MVVTIDWMSKKFKEFNEKFWNDKLVTPVFKTSRSSYRFGQAYCKTSKFSRKTISTHSFVITMSTYYDQTEHYLEETLLHEMIHMSEYQLHPEVFNFARHNFHGYYFQTEAKRINKFGYDIKQFVDEEKANSCNLSKRTEDLIKRKMERGYYLAYCRCYDGSGKFHVFKLNEKLFNIDFTEFCKKSWTKKHYDEIYIYHTSDEKYINRRSSLKSYYIVDEKEFANNAKTTSLVKIATI